MVCLDLTNGNLWAPRLSNNLDAAEILMSAEFAPTRSGNLERGLRNGANRRGDRERESPLNIDYSQPH